MKKLSIAAVVLFGFVLSTPQEMRAQTAADVASIPAPQKVADMLGMRLGLSDTQKTQLLPILQDRQTKVKAILTDDSMRPFQKKRAAEKVRDESDKQIKAMMTPDQFQQYKVLESQMQEQMKEKMQERQASN